MHLVDENRVQVTSALLFCRGVHRWRTQRRRRRRLIPDTSRAAVCRHSAGFGECDVDVCDVAGIGRERVRVPRRDCPGPHLDGAPRRRSAWPGGLLGGLLLVRTSDESFVRLLPWLMLVAAVTFTFGGRMTAMGAVMARKRWSPANPCDA